MKSVIALLAAAAALAAPAAAFAPPSVANTRPQTTALSMAEGSEDFMRWAKQSRTAGADENLVELKRPLGLVLDQDDDGNVFVQTVAPKGNAARTGLVKEGDIVTMCSATFGNDMWSTRGVGLTRVLAAKVVAVALWKVRERASASSVGRPRRARIHAGELKK